MKLCFTLPTVESRRLPMPSGGAGTVLVAVLASAIITTLVAKLWLAWRINVNWDEFHFLSNVHSLVRGDLHLVLQGAYTHLFAWIATLDLQEVDQIVLLRVLMWALLASAAWMLYRFIRIWATPAGAGLAVLALLGSWPMLKHGASFRADSLLLPLSLGALLLVCRGRIAGWRQDLAAGLLLGVAFAVTTKIALLAPVIALLVLFPPKGAGHPARGGSRLIIARLCVIGMAAVVTAAALLWAHASFAETDAPLQQDVASRTLRHVLIDVPWIPRGQYFQALAVEDPLLWSGLALGLAAAIYGRIASVSFCAASLLPILVYRNAYPYYYPVMLAPAMVLFALFADRLVDFSRRLPARFVDVAAACTLGLAIAVGAWDHVMFLRFDGQQKQRAIVTAVHRVFPEPVPYLDHSGMIASFPKVNFFMSTWGIETYRRRGRDFMPEALSRFCPPLLLVNHSVLQPGMVRYQQLRRNDQLLIEASYIDYWGPIRVLGTEASLGVDGATDIRVPCSGRYRIEADAKVMLDGARFTDGDIVNLRAARNIRATGPASAQIRLVWASARQPPASPAPSLPVYSPL